MSPVGPTGRTALKVLGSFDYFSRKSSRSSQMTTEFLLLQITDEKNTSSTILSWYHMSHSDKWFSRYCISTLWREIDLQFGYILLVPVLELEVFQYLIPAVPVIPENGVIIPVYSEYQVHQYRMFINDWFFLAKSQI
jgi:hypothetical protein